MPGVPGHDHGNFWVLEHPLVSVIMKQARSPAVRWVPPAPLVFSRLTDHAGGIDGSGLMAARAGPGGLRGLGLAACAGRHPPSSVIMAGHEAGCQPAGAAPPTAASGWRTRSPEPSLRPSADGSSTGVPASVAPRAGPG